MTRILPVRRLTLLVLLLGSGLFAQDRAVRPIAVQKKVALVIGNAAYRQAPLTNPTRDSMAIAAELKTLGFSVVTGSNLTLKEFARKVDEFTSQLQTGDLALFYYSGHGIQINRENYLLPVDYEATREADVPYTAFSASRVRDDLERSGAVLRVLILDACRNNPFKASKGGPDGLAPMGSTAEGTLIAFATGDNNTASDNPGGANGLYTQYLLEGLRQPGRELHEIFRDVKRQVLAASNRRQNPFTYDDVAGDFYFRAGPSLVAPQPSVAVAPTVVPAIEPERQPETSRTKVNAKDGLTYVWIPPGSFQMGCSPDDSKCDDGEKPPRPVTIGKGFWLGQTDVTQAAYQLVTGENPSVSKGPQLPVEAVNWNEATNYCRAVEGRLPTEAEWEYAARGGTTGARYGTLNDIAWHFGNSGKTHKVGEKRPNAFGLYDILGNVWQWTADSYDASTKSTRGGSFNEEPEYVRVSARFRNLPAFRYSALGFRCVAE